MQPMLRALWIEVDRAVSAREQAHCVQVLADYYEEMGEDDAAQLLRLGVAQRPSTRSDTPALPRLIRHMTRRSTRLFACACAEKVLSDDNRDLLSLLGVVRRFEFGLESRERLIEVQHDAYDRWSESGRVISFQQGRNSHLWALVRASGMISRTRHPNNIFADALFAARHTNRARGSRASGLLHDEQVLMAMEYLTLGRMVEESANMKEIWATSNEDAFAFCSRSNMDLEK